jgi:hypothetical protein
LNLLNLKAKIQKRIHFWGIVLFVLMNLFPPWSAAINPPKYPEKIFLGYHFFMAPPQSPFGYQSYIVVDLTILVIQWAIFFALILAAHFLATPIANRLQRGDK